MTTDAPSQHVATNMASLQIEDRSKARIPQLGGYLFTPPENVVDSFTQQEDESASEHAIEEWRKTVQPKTLPPLVHTPPDSPHTDSLPSITSATGYGVHDTPLFPEQTSVERIQSPSPLFEEERARSISPEQPRRHAVVSQSSPTTTAASPNTPSRKYFPHNLNVTTGEQAFLYYTARMQEMREMRFELPLPRTSPAWENRDEESRRQLKSLTRSAGVSKPRPTPRPASKPKAAVTTSPVKVSPPKRRTPKARTLNDFVDSAFPQKESSSKHKRAPPSKKVEGENVNWTDLPDYAPPISDLDTNSKSLKVTWHGHALPLIDDPDQVHLHDQEVQVASTLRLSCAVYLTNKRKIFQARLQSLKEGKNFTKTAAQSACKIDVNKASQLWEAFERVGWFSPDWYQQWL